MNLPVYEKAMIILSITSNCASKTTIYTLLIVSNLIHFITPNPIASKLWHELGLGIINEGENDLTGYTVATSRNGDVVAVGSPLHSSMDYVENSEINSSSRIRTGRVRVYRYNEQDGWKKIGQDIEGDFTGDEYGRSLSLNKKGNVLAVGSPYCMRKGNKEIGSVKVYELLFKQSPDGKDEDVWFQVGNTLLGSNEFDNFGYSIELGKDDTTLETFRIAIGAPGVRNDAGSQIGKVYFYSFSWNKSTSQNMEWKLESSIENSDPQSSSGFGSAISMTSDSKTIAIGAPRHGTNFQGAVKVFYQNSTDVWVEIDEIPSGISSHAPDDQCGASVSLDSSGENLAYGCSNAKVGNKYKAGKVKVLSRKSEKNRSSWVSKEITGKNEGDSFGKSLQLSASTSNNAFLIIGAPNQMNTTQDMGFQSAGLASVYYRTNYGNWDEAGLDIHGLSPYDLMGSSVAINADGHVVIAGAPNSGYAKIFNLKATAAPSQAPTSAAPTAAMTIVEVHPTSVWMVFLICVSVLGFLFIAYLLIKKIRDKCSFTGVSAKNGAVPLERKNDSELI